MSDDNPSDRELGTEAGADRRLAEHGPAWWQAADAAAIDEAAAAVAEERLSQWPRVARWRALAALLREDARALPLLERAHAGHAALGDAHAAALDAHIALVLCLTDVGAMDRVADWLQRAAPLGPAADVPLLGHPAEVPLIGRAAEVPLPGRPGDVPPLGHLAAAPPHEALWIALGTLAAGVLGAAPGAADAAALAWVEAQLQPLGGRLSPDERLIAGQVLVDVYFARQQYERFDLLAATVEEPGAFNAATPLMRSRWLYTLGFARYQIGNAVRAEDAWRRALDIAAAHGLAQAQLMTSLAMLRLLLDRGRLDEAEAIELAVQPHWGAGRTTQLIELQQMRARLLLLRDQPARALATLREALALAEHAGLTAPERASCLTDLAQVQIALQRDDEAAALLQRLAAEHQGRDAEVYRCLQALWQAWRLRTADEPASRVHLADALQRAQQARYTMFFRLLPPLAAGLCALALRWRIEPVFVTEVVRARGLPAPPDADVQWPWRLWLRLLGRFEWRLDGQPQHRAGKPQHKPLELLRLLACERSLALPAVTAADLLWPESDGAAGRKNLEMTVQRLRRLLGDDSLVLMHDGRVALDARRVSSDVAQRRVLADRLEALAMAAPPPSAEAAAAVALASALVADIVALSGGPLLPDAPEAPWLAAARERCERDARRSLRAVARLAERGEPGLPDLPMLEASLVERGALPVSLSSPNGP
jgi:DNA-binding SARP family transcriptional activator